VREQLTVGLAQWLPDPGASERNLETALALVGQLARAGCDLVVLPEMWPPGYDPTTLARDVVGAAEPLDGPRATSLSAGARAGGVWLAAGSVPERDRTGLYNTAVLYSREGDLVASHRKAHLYGEVERSAFVEGDRITTVETDELGIVGLCVCFDGDFPEVGRAMADLGAGLVLSPCAYEAEAETWWDRLYPAAALTNAQWWVMANQAGSNEGTHLFGRSRVISPTGETVAEAPRADAGARPEPSTLVVTIELAGELARAHLKTDALRAGRRPELYGVDGAGMRQGDPRGVLRQGGKR
jgi:predicted amidohydrolase